MAAIQFPASPQYKRCIPGGYSVLVFTSRKKAGNAIRFSNWKI